MPVFHLLLSIGLLAGLIYWLWRKTAFNSCWNFIFWPALGFKLFCGVLLGWFYEGGCDTFVYQHYADKVTAIGYAAPEAYLKIIFLNVLPVADLVPFATFSNSFFFIKIVSLLNFITGSNYYLNGAFISLFSFAGCWFLVQAFARIFPGTANAAVLAFLFFPTAIFWNSGVMKEPVLMGALGFFWGLALKTVYFSGKKLWLNLLLLLLTSWLLWKIKFFVALIIFSLTAFWCLVLWAYKRFSFLRRKYVLPLSLLVIIAGFAVVLSFGLQKFASAFFYRHLVWNYETLKAQSVGKPIIALNDLKPELGSVLMNIPEALAGAIFRPFFWEGDNLLYRLAGAENLVIIILFLGSLSFFKKGRKQQFLGFYGVLIAFVLIMAVLIGLTTPNLGTLNRYRTIFLPFLVYLLLQAPFWQKMLDRFNLKFKSRRV
ncbi:hypothetical protein I5M27_04020 [Adhaeribacter sp. BT258]|uniref:Glycosyltransferase RgtA/B/C/D-like domain-containing protein n=1 Tax=Adhaeribacter terrigena TaxID=2793070 RepID=A0ABS1BYE2_9BACT|nr:hypothetical protein [Adhaeribacter terrigena]MBK0402137.1 hypothetical protein [Adhaeribacter terrigena]